MHWPQPSWQAPKRRALCRQEPSVGRQMNEETGLCFPMAAGSVMGTLTSSLSLWRRWLQRSRKQCPPTIHSFWTRLWKPNLVRQWGSIITCTREETRQQRSEAFSSGVEGGPAAARRGRRVPSVKELQRARTGTGNSRGLNTSASHWGSSSNSPKARASGEKTVMFSDRETNSF